MATDPWPIDNSAGLPSYAGAELRLTTTTPFLAGAGVSLGARSGVRASGSLTDLLVQAQSSPNMTVKVNTGIFHAQGAISATQGVYTWALDTLTNVTISAAHATLARTDLIVVRIRDANVDTSGQRDGNVVAITGTAGGGVPSLPTDASYFTLAQIAVAAAATTITSGNITDKRVFTAALGGIIPCLSTLRPTSPMLGQKIYETDTTLSREWDGTTWWMSRPYRQSQSLGSSAATVAFTGIPATLKTVRVTYSAKGDANANLVTMSMRVNGLSTAIYYWQKLEVANATTTSVNLAGQTAGEVATLPAMPAGVGTTFATGVVDVAGWDQIAAQATGMTWIARSGSYRNGSDSRLSLFEGLATTNPPWSSLTFIVSSGNFAAGTEFTLEGWD